MTNLLFYGNNQSFFQQNFESNMRFIELIPETFEFVNISHHTIGKAATLLKNVTREYDASVDDTITFGELREKINKKVAQIQPTITGDVTVTIVNGPILGSPEMELLFINLFVVSDRFSSVRICDVLKTKSQSIHISQFLMLFALIERLNPGHIISFVDDPTQVKYAWASQNAKVTHYYYHPLSNSSELVKAYGFKYSPYPFYAMLDPRAPQMNLNKNVDFMVGITDYVPNTYRTQILDPLVTHSKNTDSFFVRYVSHNERLMGMHESCHDLVSYSSYLSDLCRARFTLSVPSYHEEVWSNRRFWEAIHRDCLPFIFDPLGMRFAGLHFDAELIELCQELVVTMKELQTFPTIIERFPEEVRVKLLHDIRNTTTYKNLTNIQYHESYAATI